MVSPRSFGVLTGVNLERLYLQRTDPPNRSESLSDAGFCVPTGRHSGRNYGDRRTIVRYGDPPTVVTVVGCMEPSPRNQPRGHYSLFIGRVRVQSSSLLERLDFGTLWHALVLSTVFGFGTIGVPVLLWLRYKIRSPGVLLMGILLFWHVLVYIPRLEVARVIRPDSSSCSSGHQYISSAMPS